MPGTATPGAAAAVPWAAPPAGLGAGTAAAGPAAGGTAPVHEPLAPPPPPAGGFWATAVLPDARAWAALLQRLPSYPEAVRDGIAASIKQQAARLLELYVRVSEPQVVSHLGYERSSAPGVPQLAAQQQQQPRECTSIATHEELSAALEGLVLIAQQLDCTGVRFGRPRLSFFFFPTASFLQTTTLDLACDASHTLCIDSFFFSKYNACRQRRTARTYGAA